MKRNLTAGLPWSKAFSSPSSGNARVTAAPRVRGKHGNHLRREVTALAVVCLFLNLNVVLPLSMVWAATPATPRPGALAIPAATAAAELGAPRPDGGRYTIDERLQRLARGENSGQFELVDDEVAAGNDGNAPAPALTCDVPVTLKPLKLDHVPSETELRAAGGLSGPLAPIGNADEDVLKVKLAKYFGFSSVQEFDTLSQEAEQGTVPANPALAGEMHLLFLARKKVERLEAINLDFGKGLVARCNDDWPTTYKLFSNHIKQYPDSPWAGEAMLHLAIDDTNNGRYALALARYQAILKVTSDDPADPTYEVRQKAKGGWVNLDLRLGQWDDAIGKLKEILATDADDHRRIWASSWLLRATHLATAKNGHMIACGSQALGAMLAGLQHPKAAARVRGLMPPNSNGFTLDELARISGQYGVRLRGFRIDLPANSAVAPGPVSGQTPSKAPVPVQSGSAAFPRELQLARLPLPFIVHYDVARAAGTDFGLRTGSALWTSETFARPANAARASAPASGLAGMNMGMPGMSMNMPGMAMPGIAMPGMGSRPARPVRAKAARGKNQFMVMPGMDYASLHALPAGQPEAFTVHSVGHFVLVTAIDLKAEQVTVQDPLTPRPLHLSFADFDRQWSGAGLVFDHKLPEVSGQPVSYPGANPARGPEVTNAQVATLQWLGRGALAQVQGACCCPWDPNGPLGKRKNLPQGPPGCGSSHGSPMWTVDPSSMNTFIEDVPAWFNTASGPSLELSLAYNSDDASSGGLYTPNTFGNKWRFSYGSYITEESNGDVEITEGDGRVDTFTNSGAGWVAPVGDYDTLSSPSAHAYVVTAPTGETATYGAPMDPYNNPLGLAANVITLLQVEDRFQNILKVRDQLLTQTVTTGTAPDINTSTYTWFGPAQVTDAANDIMTFQYDSGGRCDQVNFGSRCAQFTYDDTNNLVSATDMGGAITTYSYDGYDDVSGVGTTSGQWGFNIATQATENNTDGNYETRITDPMDHLTDYLLTGKTGYYCFYTDPDGHETMYNCAALSINGNPTITGIGRATQLDPTHNPLTPADWTQLGYDPTTGQVTSLTNPDNVNNPGHETAYATYNAYGLPTATESANGVQTTYTYDTSNNLDLTSVTNNQGTVLVTLGNYTNHEPGTVTVDPNGRDQITTYTYESWGDLASATDSSGTTNYTYNSARLLTQVNKGTVDLATLGYDQYNRVAWATDATGFTTHYTYNDLDHPTVITYPDGTTKTYDYMCCSLPGMVTDRQGRKSYCDYDSLKRPVRYQDSDGNTLQYTYDNDGNLVELIDGQGSVTRWEYDTLSRVTKKIQTDGTTQTYGYDPASQLTNYTDGRGIQTTISYDYDGNRTGLQNYDTLDNISTIIAWSYDNLDRPQSMTDSSGTTSWTYTTEDQVASESLTAPTQTTPYAQVSYTYDALGRRSSISAAGAGTQTYSFDTNSCLTGLTETAPWITGLQAWSWTYATPAGLVSQAQAPNGVTAAYTYDSLDRLTNVQNSIGTGPTVLSNYAYGYTGNRDACTSLTRQIVDSNGNQEPQQLINYSYGNNTTATDRLTQEASTETPPLLNKTYGYDTMGNRVSTTDQSNGLFYTPQVTTTSGNILNQHTSFTTTTGGGTPVVTNQTFDQNGNLAETQTVNGATYTTYQFDGAERLTQITKYAFNGVFVARSSFIYDGFGRRKEDIEQTFSGSTNTNGAWTTTSDVLFVYDGMNVIEELDNRYTSRPLLAYNVWAGTQGGLLSRATFQYLNGTLLPADNATSYYSYDGRGNVTQLTNSAGSVVAYYNYDAFGNVTSGGGPQYYQPYGYATKWVHAPTGLIDYGFRFYNPGTGTWISRDPLSEDGGTDIYEFAGNDPVNMGDAFGLSVFDTMFDTANNVVAGDADAMFGPYPKRFRKWMGVDSLIDYCSTAYAIGHAVGTVHQQVLIGALGGEAIEGASAICSVAEGASEGAPLIEEVEECEGGGCFVAGTPVVMADGKSVPIEKIRVGDKVLSRDARTGKNHIQKVERTTIRPVLFTRVLTFSDDSRVVTTDEHPFYAEGRGFTAARELGIGTSIVTRAGPALKVVGNWARRGQTLVYNLTVGGTHSYFVGTGERALWVHNNSCQNVREILEGYKNQAVETLKSEGITRGQVGALEDNPNLESAFKGERVDWFFRLLKRSNSALDDLVETPRGKVGPDILDYATKTWYDVTTPGEIAGHIAKYAKVLPGWTGVGLLYSVP